MTHAIWGADVNFYFVAKGNEFNQVNPGQPVSKGNSARFIAELGLSATNSVSNATIQALPTGPVNTLALQSVGKPGTLDTLSYQAKYASQSALDTAFPNGNYQLVVHAVHDGTKTLTLGLTGNGYPASAPHINGVDTNLNVVIISNSAAAFTLKWSPFTGGTANDFILLTLADINGVTLYQTPGPGQPGALNGTVTSLVIPANSLPSGSQIGGQLVFAKFAQTNTTSYAGVPGYAAYYTGTSFGLATLANDVAFYNLSKHQVFTQNSPNSPTLAGSPFRFVAQVSASASNSVSSAQLQLPPPGGPETLVPDPTDTLLAFQENFGNQAQLDAAFVSGSYALQINTVHDGGKFLPITMPADSFPNAPQINDWAAAQNISPASVFQLTWNAFSGATTQDDVHVLLSDSLGNAVTDTLLPGTATTFDFPAGTFQSGQSYQGQVQFRRFVTVDYSSYPGAAGSVRFLSRTVFNLASAGTSAPPSLTVITTNGASPFQLLLTGQSGLLYAVDASTNLLSALWVPLVTNSAVAGQFIFADAKSSNFPVRFYRGRAAQ